MKIFIYLFTLIITICAVSLFFLKYFPRSTSQLLSPVLFPNITSSPSATPKPTIYPTITKSPPSPRPKPSPSQSVSAKAGDTSPWGVSQQIGQHTWTLKINLDPKMATPSEILSALNNYRPTYNSQPLTWNDKLAKFAQDRADYLASIKGTDDHKGFSDYLNNQDGFNQLGFTWLGENISYGYRLEAVHLIEWVYAGDQPHNENQLNNRWNYVGIGVKDTATCIIFATGKK
jgi:uncharacterized protein YkwD